MQEYCGIYNRVKRMCAGFTINRCDGKATGCPMFRTMTAQKESDEAHDERLRSLPEDSQAYIAEKFYKGERPWMHETHATRAK